MLKYNLLIVCCIGFPLLAGCYGNNGRQAVEGTVTLDGRPLGGGLISFRPMSGTGGPSAGSPIDEGRFSIAAENGVFAGNFRVAITASRKTGRKMQDPMLGTMVDETAEAIPACYNRQSTLSAKVKAGDPNQFEFALKSQ